jgi:hypothetical protein
MSVEPAGDGVEATAWRFLRDVYLRVIGLCTIHPGQVMSIEEQNAALDRHLSSLQVDHAVLMTIVARCRDEGAEDIRARIHSAEGVDHEMLDEAIDWSGGKDMER